ncbi:DUF3800 domain-containing protein [uncultured Roseovarius sp.]|uniref:DUF3800 domain-containing protein n=1 Tax=uncultured Roseovarius sp. TaxID=293344 RepID=UPI0025DDC0FB|nr:DUF3800 domain-containing protein [uncultured Roseovarius sp.]
MFLIYYDEVKFERGVQPAHWFGGIAVHVDEIGTIEAELNQLAKEIFGQSVLNLETEFHAKDIFHGKNNFKGMPFEERLAVFERLVSFTALDEVSSIYARVELEKVHFISTKAEGEELAFMYFIEKTDEFLKRKRSYGMLIGDYDEPNIGPSVANLSKFRDDGTKFSYGREIKQLVDTVHFAKSHHSRLIQLADVDLYCRQFMCQKNETNSRKALVEIIRKYSAKRFPKKYKDYPSLR